MSAQVFCAAVANKIRELLPSIGTCRFRLTVAVDGRKVRVEPQLRPYREELGVTQFILRTNWAGMPVADSLNSIKLITQELLPELRKL